MVAIAAVSWLLAVVMYWTYSRNIGHDALNWFENAGVPLLGLMMRYVCSRKRQM